MAAAQSAGAFSNWNPNLGNAQAALIPPPTKAQSTNVPKASRRQGNGAPRVDWPSSSPMSVKKPVRCVLRIAEPL